MFLDIKSQEVKTQILLSVNALKNILKLLKDH